MFFESFPNIFDSDLKEFFDYIASEEENIDYNLFSRQILISSEKFFSFSKYGDLYNFWFNLLLNKINLDDIKSQQIKFLKDLMNGFELYKKIKKQKNELNYKVEDLYLILLRNSKKAVYDIFFKNPKNKVTEEIYLQSKILFDLRGKSFKKLFNKGIIKSDSDQSDLKYKESIAERTNLRRQELEIIKEKEKNMDNGLIKKYFKYQSPNNMYNTLSDINNTEEGNIQVNLTKSGLIDLKKDIRNTSKDAVNKIEEMYKVADIVELVPNFDEKKQVKSNQILSSIKSN